MTKSGRRGAKAYLAASIISQACALARYTLLARLLGPEQLGLAATLILTVQFFQSISDSGSDRFLIQDRRGDEPAVQRLVQLVFIGRGIFTAAFLALAAAPAAAWLGQNELAGGLVFLAIYPLIAGFVHLDMRRTQRSNDFRTEAWAQLAGESAGLIATAVAAFLTRDFTAVVYGLIARSVIIVGISHFRAQRRYSAGFAKEHASRLRGFATPLLANGLLLFIGSQGDRVIVGQQLGFTALGIYTAVLLLIFYPTGALTRFMSAMHLPKIAAEASAERPSYATADRLGGQAMVLAVTMSAGFALVAPAATHLLYGPEFHQPGLLVALIGILQTARFIRLWPATVALATGRSGIVLANNLVRMLGLPAAILGTMLIGNLPGLIAGFILGEMLAFATAILLLNRALARPIATGLGRMALFLVVFGCIVGWPLALQAPSAWALIVLTIASTLALAWLVSRERRVFAALVATLRRAVHGAMR